MNRLTLLASIHRQLRDNYAETGELRPLGEIVSLVAREIRGEQVKKNLETSQPRVIPIEKISAFVDGELSVADEGEIVEAVQYDNSVLAELISAVRATQVAMEDLPPLSYALSAQLRAMKPPLVGDIAEADDSVWTSIDDALVVVNEGQKTDVSPTKRSLPWVFGAIAIAASVIAAIALLGRGGNDQENRDLPERRVVQDTPKKESPPKQEAPKVAPEDLEDLPESESVVVEVPQSDPQTAPDALVRDDADVPMVPPVNPPVTSELPKTTPPMESVPIDSIAIVEPESSQQLKWTDVVGLFAVRNETTNTGPTRSSTWNAIQEGTTARPSSEATNHQVAIRTMPYSRAGGEFPDGGRVVVASDTGLNMNHRGADSAAIDLLHGAFAMIDLSEDTVVTLQQAGKRVATLRWKGKATAVVVRQLSGLQIQVNGGQIEINDEPVKDKSVVVSDDGSMEPIRAPRRLARWVKSKNKNTPAEGLVLAQIASSNDAGSSLNQAINRMSSRQNLSREETNLLAKLASWQVAMSGVNLYRLTNSRVAIVRMTALQRLLQMPERDPRYARTWALIDRALNDRQRSNQLRSWFQMIQTGTRPNRTQLETLMRELTTRDYAGRAVADFVLRQFVVNPPPFDPSWTNQTLTRAVSIYRQRAGLPARPSGASNIR